MTEPRFTKGSGAGWTRRELIRAGGLGGLGLSLANLLRCRSASANLAGSANDHPLFGQAKNVIYVFLNGGPSQYETFDPKPAAPVEIRGSFRPIATNVPGIDICELLPRTARIVDKLAIARAMVTDDPNHESGGYYVNTGRRYAGPNMRALNPTDWPALASLVKMLRPSDQGPFTSVMLPEPIVANPNVFLPGQNAGFLGRQWDPEIFLCDPAAPDFKIDGFALPDDLPAGRLERRHDLLTDLDQLNRRAESIASLKLFDHYAEQALSILVSGAARDAFRMEREPDKLRDRYGRGKWGQSLLLARRLIEAGVRLAFVNWPREPGDLSASNPLWDTHAQNDPRMRDVLCPQFDLGFTALIEDLDQRGLLSETLVVAIGEMGRTPRFNPAGGRDHWGNVFPFVMAGAGIKTALVHGSSDREGAYAASGRVQPEDLTATILHLLGVSHESFFKDALDRPLRATEGEPIAAVLGTGPATQERREPEGTVPSLASADPRMLIDGGFESRVELAPLAAATRGWRADPLFDPNKGDEFCVYLARVPGARSRGGEHHVGIGYGMATGEGRGRIPQGTRAMLMQEIHNPRPGEYTFSVFASGAAYDRPEYYRDVWLRNFTSRLVIFGFADKNKDPRRLVEFASVEFAPPFAGADAADYQKYSVSVRIESQNAGAAKIDKGVGVAVIVEKTSPGALDVPSGGPRSQGLIRIDDATLDFTP